MKQLSLQYLEQLLRNSSTTAGELSPETALAIDTLVRRRDDCPICNQVGRDWCAECPSNTDTAAEIERELEFARSCSKNFYLRQMVEFEKNCAVRLAA